jgi:eukaryotic-like serine/threonine-protein kinase
MLHLEDFAANVVKSGLVPTAILDQARAGLPPVAAGEAAVQLARRLIQDKRLTAFQAKKLLSGKTNGFFLGGYRLLKPLGEGGMGKVYLAQSEAGERVAVKVLPPRKALEDANALLRFRREMDLSRRCAHPNIARTLSVGSEGDIHFMVMEYIPGESLFDMVKGARAGPLRVTDAARLFLKLTDGLDAAHKAGLIHRDIKPSNVMITPDSEVKLLDLGLARALDDEKGITRANTVLGTLDYASPEQLGDASKADRRSDLYSVGCTLYFAVSGRAPFEGGDMINKIFKQRMEDPPPLESVARGVPSAFAAVVRKLMNKKPDERYQECVELRADLARWTDPRRVHAILGAEAEAARSFRPPPPELDEDDLRLFDRDDPSIRDSVSLRDLGDSLPSVAPRHQQPLPPLTAAVRPAPSRETRPARHPRSSVDDSTWLFQFAVIAIAIGVVAVILIAILQHL